MMFTKTAGFNDAGRDSPILLTFSLTTRERSSSAISVVTVNQIQMV